MLPPVRMGLLRKAVWLHYDRWVIFCKPRRVAGGWCSIVDVWQSDGDPKQLRQVVPLTPLFESAADACVAGLEAGKRWIDARRSK